ncbi:MAG TPA: citramalate synthase [Bryobacteraceae bacterium]|nr:citramalate synthase [Bryobacteraceae bacterium]
MRIRIFDSTLRDGAQADRVSFTVDDKLQIARGLDRFGVDYIDGGWPAVDPRDREFFDRARSLALKHAKLSAFGSVRSTSNTVGNDPNIQALLAADTPVVCLAGESWDIFLPVAHQGTSEDYLRAIADSIRFFKERGREVIYDAEHFFDAYENHPDFALRTLTAARDAGGDVLCLCDTRGWTLTTRLAQICSDVRKRFDVELGIHAHNDADLAVANTMAAIEQGFTHVQGCMNGYGERCGCANLCSIIPNIELKEGHETVGRENLDRLSPLAHFIAELTNLPVRNDQPYVGANAFGQTRKEHLRALGERKAAENTADLQQQLADHVAGPGNLLWKLTHYRAAAKLPSDRLRMLFDRIRLREEEGYDLAGADGTLELLAREAVNPDVQFFTVLGYEVTTRKTAMGAETRAEVTIEVDNTVSTANACGHGPVHALDLALRQCLSTVYASLGTVQLADYRVRVLDPAKGTAAKVRALIEWSDGGRTWSTAGVFDDVIEASWIALTDAIRLELMRLLEKDGSIPQKVEDRSWAV